VAELVAQRLAAPSRAQQQRARRAQGEDRHHRVLGAAAADGVAVPRHAVAAVAVEAQSGGHEGLAQLAGVVPGEVGARLLQQRVG
jgi:hypothetical protein